MQKLLFIVNPCAGQKKILRHLPEVISQFSQAGYEVTIYMTGYSGHATQIAEERCGAFDLVVCAGGDGTLNEVITGILRSGAGTPIGYIPCGSTNDFATTLRIPLNIPQAAKIITDGVPVAHDVGSFGDRYFSYVASFGAFTRASYATAQNVKNALGHLAYWLEGISELAQIRPVHARFEYDGKTVEGDYIFGAISNSTSVGGVLTLDRNRVDLQDGKFELLLVRSPKDRNEVRDLLLALTEQRYESGVFTMDSFSRLTVCQNDPTPWSLDGERAEGLPCVNVENLHQAIQIIHNREET